jgi:4-hydroxybenzoyl-CoA thioesterase
MPRVHIALPERFTFRTVVPLYVSHVNASGHLDNAQLLALVAEGRERFVRSMGYAGSLDIDGLSYILADVAVQYRAEAFYGETMVIEMDANDFNKRGCDLVFRVSDLASGREVARGKHGIVFFDYTARRVAEVPAGFRARWP